ncbi:MAG: flagellar protein FlaG [Gallionella sp.]|nr:flagellar protein FlaG [Gallionella sp.]
MLIQNTSSMTQPVRLTSDTAAAAPAVISTPVVTSGTQTEKPDAPVRQAEKPLTDTQMQETLDHINAALLNANINIQFNVGANGQKAVLKLIDTQTGEVIRQFPTDAALSISRSIEQFQQGLLLNQKA